MRVSTAMYAGQHMLRMPASLHCPINATKGWGASGWLAGWSLPMQIGSAGQSNCCLQVGLLGGWSLWQLSLWRHSCWCADSRASLTYRRRCW